MKPSRITHLEADAEVIGTTNAEIREASIAEYRTNQIIRLTSVVTVSPLLIYTGIKYRKELPNWLSISMVAGGVLSGAYNAYTFYMNWKEDGKLIHEAAILLKEEKKKLKEQKLEVRSQKSEEKEKQPEARSQKSEEKGKQSEVESPKSENKTVQPVTNNQQPAITINKSELERQLPDSEITNTTEVINQKPEEQKEKPEVRSQKSEEKKEKEDSAKAMNIVMQTVTPANGSDQLAKKEEKKELAIDNTQLAKEKELAINNKPLAEKEVKKELAIDNTQLAKEKPVIKTEPSELPKEKTPEIKPETKNNKQQTTNIVPKPKPLGIIAGQQIKANRNNKTYTGEVDKIIPNGEKTEIHVLVGKETMIFNLTEIVIPNAIKNANPTGEAIRQV